MALPTLAVLVTLGMAAAPTLTVKIISGKLEFGANVAALVQVTRLPTALQVQSVPMALTNPKPAGKLSVTVTVPALVDGPRLRTVNTYCPFKPTVKIPRWRLAMVKSAFGVKASVSLAVLLLKSESVTSVGTTKLAVLTKLLVAALERLAVNVNTALELAAKFRV